MSTPLVYGIIIAVMTWSPQMPSTAVSQFPSVSLFLEIVISGGSDGPHQQMLLVYLLRITSNTMALHYFNDSSSSQQNPSRQQLCTANEFDIVKVISESCLNRPHVELPIEDSECCSNVNISVNFSERWMEIHFLRGFIGIPVYYLSCTSKS